MKLLHCFVVLLIIFSKSTNSELLRHTFVIEYFSGSPDGVYKENILGINGRFPGPVIEAQIGDVLQVDVVNRIQDRQNVSIHWHGIHQKETPWDDGPPYITQCPLAFSQTQRYSFQLKQSGTFWYHSHVHSQYTDGLWGVLIVHKPEPYSYDGYIVIALSDWYHHTALENEAFQNTPKQGIFPYPDSGLINGVGRYDCGFAMHPCNISHQVRPVFKVQKDKIYRVHVLNTGALVAYNFSIDGHPLQVIETDSIDVKEGMFYDVASISSGQRYSFLIKTNVDGAKRFHIRAQLRREISLLIFAERINNNKYPEITIGNISAILEYSKEDSVEFEPFSFLDQVPPIEEELNHLDEMKLAPLDGAYAPKRYDLEVVLSIEFFEYTDGVRRGSLNKTPFLLPEGTKPLLMTIVDGEEISEDHFHIEVNHMQVVQIILNNPGGGPHPFHLHGHDFWVLGKGGWNDGNFKAERDNQTLVLTGPKRDTVMVEERSWIVIRFIADNPGVWLFHCHIDWHKLTGMATVFVVGRKEIQKMKITDEARHVCKYNMYNIDHTNNNTNCDIDCNSNNHTDSDIEHNTNIAPIANSSIDHLKICAALVYIYAFISFFNFKYSLKFYQ